jgi:hypothetical protein
VQTDVMHPDLFLGESPLLEERRHLEIKMPDGGHAATPGSGPIGKECWQCVNSVRHFDWHDREYLKCDRVTWTPQRETDIKESDAACLFFEGEPSTSALDARTLQDILEGK